MAERSWTRRMFEAGIALKQRYGEENVFDLSLGNPVKVLTVPGRGFKAPGYFRISYCVDDKTLEGSLAGFTKPAQKPSLCQFLALA